MNAINGPRFYIHKSVAHLKQLLRLHIVAEVVVLGHPLTVSAIAVRFLASEKQLYRVLREMTVEEQYLHRTTHNGQMAYVYDAEKENPYYGKSLEELKGSGSHGGKPKLLAPPRPVQDYSAIPGPWNQGLAQQAGVDSFVETTEEARELSPLEQVLLLINDIAEKHRAPEPYIDRDGYSSKVAVGSDKPVRDSMFADDVHALLGQVAELI